MEGRSLVVLLWLGPHRGFKTCPTTIFQRTALLMHLHRLIFGAASVVLLTVNVITDCGPVCAQRYQQYPPPRTSGPPVYSPLPQVPNGGYGPPVGSPPNSPPPSPPPGYQPPNANYPPPYGVRQGAPYGNPHQPPYRMARANPAPPPREFDAGRWLASVGNLHILAGDVEPEVNMILAPYVGKAPEFELEEQRKLLVRQLLKSAVESKLVYLDFLRTVPKENVAQIKNNVAKKFYENLQDTADKLAVADEKETKKILHRERVLGKLAQLALREGVDVRGGLDAVLRRYGSSLAKQRLRYIENGVVQSMIFRNVNPNVEIPHQKMLDYYQEHLQDYSFPARARWEEIMVRFDRFRTKRDARNAIEQMHWEVYIGGAPFDAVARRGSQGYTASQGGKQDWTSQGSLKSKELDHALFHWQPLRLSDPIEDRDGFHVIRILERHDAGRTPFSEVQDEIEAKLRRQYRNEQVKKYLAKVKENALVRTVYDNEQQPGSSSQTAPARQNVSRRNTGGRFRP